MRQRKIRYDGTVYAVDLTTERHGLSEGMLESWVPTAPTAVKGVCGGKVLRDDRECAVAVTYGRIIMTWDSYTEFRKRDSPLIWILSAVNNFSVRIESTVGRIYRFTRRVPDYVDRMFPIEITEIE